MFSAEVFAGLKVPICFLIKLRPILGGCLDWEGRYSERIEASAAFGWTDGDSLKQVEAILRIGFTTARRVGCVEFRGFCDTWKQYED